ncbi:MAG: 1-(5-phosphoribosyl)-5-[(5-phosphoribosylamino)methylideneamino] imidazole-4-carboxamide isomerase [Cyclobacteriaceae bacterium]
MKIVPSISVIKGKTTRLTKGDFNSEKTYDVSPLEVAKNFEDHGIERIHLLDLDGARKGSPVNYPTLETIAGYTNLRINFSGGIHTDGDISKSFEYGATSITSATVAVYNKELFASWLMSYGRSKIALGADCLNGLIRIGGWQKGTEIKLFDHISYFYERGLQYIKTTDISRDGALEGPAFDLYEQIGKQFPDLKVFASGGIRNIDDIKKLRDQGLYGVIFGKAFYEEKITLKELESLIAEDK